MNEFTCRINHKTRRATILLRVGDQQALLGEAPSAEAALDWIKQGGPDNEGLITRPHWIGQEFLWIVESIQGGP